MNRPAELQSIAEVCDAQICIAALNSLADGLFLLDTASGMCRPLNHVARQMVEDFGPSAADNLTTEWQFPDFVVPSHRWHDDSSQLIQESSHLAHWYHHQTGTLCDVHIELRPFSGLNGDWQTDARRLAIVRRLGVSASAGGLLPRDAFDDSFHDWLTRLPNRRLFARRLERAVRRGNGSDYHYAVLFVDLDRFKGVNDQFGHLLGDRLLVLVAQRLLEIVRPQDMVARRDGDEFTILLDDLESAHAAVGVAERIVEHLSQPFLVEGTQGVIEVAIGASIGVSLPGSEPTTADGLIVQADSAMYQAKSLGGGTFATLTGPGNKPHPR